jgi:hypothetical protein
MSKLKVSDLHSTGYQLFQDSESFLLDIKDEEINLIQGGIIFPRFSVIQVPASEDIFVPSISIVY